MQIVAFDFAAKREWALDPGDWARHPDAGIFYWIVAGADEQSSIRDAMDRLCVSREVASLIEGPQPEAHLEINGEALHFTVTEARVDDRVLKTGVLSFLLGGNFLVTVVPGESRIMDRIRRIYRDDFNKFARSSGFLLFELGSCLLESNRRVFEHYTEEAESIQLRLFDKVTDDIFSEVSELTGDILAFRRSVLSARDLFNDLATRKSAFVSETTQPSLDMLSDRMGRLGDDIAGIRSVLNETLNLYMGMVSHRTNRIINRLTVFSMIFLPLSFLAGVYGMNFKAFPELSWEYAYPAFWVFVALFVAGFVLFVRRKHWI
ncbi:MAG: CorA family divalent cation transporter [Candidatus Fermentibacteraceae bacterium]